LRFLALADLADADPVLALGRDVKDLGSPFNRSLLIGRVYLAQMLGAFAEATDQRGMSVAVTKCQFS
jgi:hypothetical protein